jgi:hypothetical protein
MKMHISQLVEPYMVVFRDLAFEYKNHVVGPTVVRRQQKPSSPGYGLEYR